jgi:DNA-binding transcriptional LysR family regulator
MVMQAADFPRLKTFIAVAERGSFVKAAEALSLSTSTVSQSIRVLEERLGVRLLNRTTRSVALTEAGESLLARARPALHELGSALEDLASFKESPSGTLRLVTSSMALSVVVAPVLRAFMDAHPKITLDTVVDDQVADLIDARIDAGIRSPDRIPQDMVAVRVLADGRRVAVASPDYLRRHGAPSTPGDLLDHNCIQLRLTNGAIHRWAFDDEHGRKVEVPVQGSLITDNVDLVLRAAIDGVGIGFTIESHAAQAIRDGLLHVVLEPYAPVFPGLFIYYPRQRHIPAPLRLFIDFIKTREVLTVAKATIAALVVAAE